MGLAASQARYLGLTARKSNIEYEGQQVNQQRMALAEEVNSLYNKLLSLDVPVAPETTEFYESNYSFELTHTDDYDGSYIIKNYYMNDDGTYYINAERTYDKNVAVGKKYNSTSLLFDSGVYVYTDDEGNTHTLTPNALNAENMIKLINGTYGDGTVSDSEQFYYYQSSEGVTYYFPASEVEKCTDPEFAGGSRYNATNTTVTEPVAFAQATLTFDSNNRMSGISNITDPTTGDVISSGTSSVDTTRTYDNEGYEAALRDYTMSKDEYDKTMADLNAQTESLQQEDKVLELRLNQIDTEQKELNTELEAVKEVLKTNVENTFKTFA